MRSLVARAAPYATPGASPPRRCAARRRRIPACPRASWRPDGGDARAAAAALLLSASMSAQLALSPAALAAVAPPAAAPPVEAASATKASPDAGPAAKDAPPTKAFPAGSVRYSEFLAILDSGDVWAVLLSPDNSGAGALMRDGRVIATVLDAAAAADLLSACQSRGIDVIVAESKSEFEANVPQLVPPLLRLSKTLAFTVVPAVMVGTIVIVALRLLRGGVASLRDTPFAFLKLRGSEAANSAVRFSDVAGVEGAVQELREVVDFLKNPGKYSSLGAKIPKGVLLSGPPGTGKTLLAKAVAGEAGVPFFSVAASEFVEMFVGVGASRVRDLFEKAKSKAPCIVFIDELDAVGRQRGVGFGGGSDEREQTINQLLNEMDGFQPNAGVIVLAATNREDVLDKALTRPGRFDRRITVDLPDLAGRLAILRIYAKTKPMAADVDLARLARRTPGFSGADLANLLNEAAIMAARHTSAQITAAEVADALEKIAMGPEKAHALTTPEKKKLVAYHEAGHAIVGALMPDYDRVEKISIVPRTASAGATLFVPNEERLAAGFYSRSFLLSQLSVALGGRAAEELAFGAESVTTGAADDLRAVTKTARLMVEVAGLSRRFTHAAMRGPDGDVSVQTADEAAREVAAVVQEAYARALALLRDNRGALERVAQRLIDREMMDGAELDELLAAEGARMCTTLRVAADAPAADAAPSAAGSAAGGDGTQR